MTGPGQPRRRLVCGAATLATLAAALASGVAMAADERDPRRHLPPVGAPYQAQEMRIGLEEGVSLGGTLTVPERPRRHPVVVLVSSAGSEDRDHAVPGSRYRPFYEIADTLSRRGVAVLRLDDRGVGASSGTLDSLDTFERSFDTRAALELLRKRPDVDPNRLVLLGLGEGAAIASIVAASDSDLAGIVMLGATAAPGRELARARLRGALPSALAAWERLAANDPWTSFFAEYDPQRTARRVRVPVLLLNAGADAIVPPEGADTLAAAFRAGGNSRVTQRTFSDLGNGFLPSAIADARETLALGTVTPPRGDDVIRMPREVLGAIADWVAGTVEARAGTPKSKAAKAPKRKARGRR